MAPGGNPIVYSESPDHSAQSNGFNGFTFLRKDLYKNKRQNVRNVQNVQNVRNVANFCQKQNATKSTSGNPHFWTRLVASVCSFESSRRDSHDALNRSSVAIIDHENRCDQK
ncbi:hypothetical protein L596_013718 [Steinernema carpocapsae]|uniref:Uncharacterized protein n=1 Tax=Steinernema carpocapsae TaxID=34508 RepID=A0A4U5P100_STECR|nr:hypothetical protein L596_013718 [Steinernema carpocapsae]